MPIESRPLFRLDALRAYLRAFRLPDHANTGRDLIHRWADLLASSAGQEYKESELLPDFLTDIFVQVLGYTTPTAQMSEGRHTLSREKLVEVDGKFADAVLGDFRPEEERVVVAVEGKGPRDPLERPHAGRKMSAVDQGYRYAINVPCDWIIVTNLREIRLYHKGSTQRTYERFVLAELAESEEELKRFVFLLGAERMVPRQGPSHLYALLEASEKAGEELTQQFYAEYAQVRSEVLLALLEANSTVEPSEVLSATQRLLDRVLFVAFAEDRGLLPAETLAKAYQHRDPYNPRGIWANFQGLFRAIDQGSDLLNIPRYNGGLFAADEVLDKRMSVPDAVCQRLKRLGDYNYRAPGQDHAAQDEAPLVDVEILGHVFEQSIEDVEAIRARLEGGEEVTRATSRRRREGAFYTPSYATRYITGEALKPVLAERFQHLRIAHQQKAGGTAVQVLEDPRTYDVEKLNRPQRDALVRFWERWTEELKTVRVLDPSCGSGAFLIEAFDQLHLEYQHATERLNELREGGFAASLFDPDRTILQQNLYGVDLNEEATEIARLSIWIKTAQRGKVLTDLDHNIRVGNSIVDDPELDPRAFHWEAAFPEVFAQGGFDVVVGNPPYVRAELLAEIKPHLQKRYAAYHGGADLYVYFYELGLRLLRPGGRLSYIVTNKWLKAGYGEPLRCLFAQHGWVEEIVDLGHAKQIFPDADVFPSIVRVQKPTDEPAPEALHACIIPRDEFRAEELSEQIRPRRFEMPRRTLDATPWTLEPPALSVLLDKVRAAGIPLKDYLGTAPYRGLMTGYNSAYLITIPERNALVSADPRCEPIIQPYLRGQDVKRWTPAWADLWMVVMRSSGDYPWPWADAGEDAEVVFARTYPSLYAHFKLHEERLRKRTDQGVHWWELRSCDYYDLFAAPRIIHTDITWRPEFCFVGGPMYLVNTSYMWPTDDLYVLGVLNSPLLWSYMWRNTQHGKDEALRLFSALTETIPIAPPANEEIRTAVSQHVRELIDIARARQENIGGLLDWLQVEFAVEKAGTKLSAPHEINSDTFVAEVKKRRAGSSTVTAAELRRLRDEFYRTVGPLRRGEERASALERQISEAVNAAYGLTLQEVDLLWRTAPPRMPEPARPPAIIQDAGAEAARPILTSSAQEGSRA